MTAIFAELDVSHLESKDTADYIKLHRTLFPRTDITEEWVDWYFHKLFPDTPVVYGAREKDSGELIGMWCVEHRTLIDSDAVKKHVGRCFAVGIREDHRRKNLFTELSKYAIKEEKRKATFTHILGFPQLGKPVVSAHIKAGWEHVQRIQAYTKKPQRTLESPHRVFRATPDFWLSEPEFSNCGTFQANGLYISERWGNHPYHNYTILCHDDLQCSFAVTKQYRDILHVLEFRYKSAHAAYELIASINQLAYRHACSEITIWAANNDPLAEYVKNSGFLSAEAIGSCAVSSVDLLAVNLNSDPLKLETSSFQMGVEEIY